MHLDRLTCGGHVRDASVASGGSRLRCPVTAHGCLTVGSHATIAPNMANGADQGVAAAC